MKKVLSSKQRNQLFAVLRSRFEKNMKRHENVKWLLMQERLEAATGKLWSLSEMERTGGEPDVIAPGEKSDGYFFYDCSAESPAGRRNLCYDKEALESRKEHRPQSSAVEMAAQMGIELLGEEEYRTLQQFGTFDAKTSSWIKTPGDIRKLGGALFADFRYGKVFVYHNGAQSYYGARGFRGRIRI